MNAHSQPRLAARIGEVARQHQAAMLQFESTGSLLGDLAAAEATSEWDIYRCRDAVELCQWWTFNLERIDLSIGDAAPAAAGEPSFSLAGDGSESALSAECRELVREFERLRHMMESVSEQYLAAMASVSDSDGSGEPAGAVDLPDLDPLREVLAAAVERAEALSGAAGAEGHRGAGGSAKP